MLFAKPPQGPLKGILGYSDEPLVSSDYQETHARRLSTAYQRW
jgi:glyceraldehyde-3-phosphate dehydrogenase/erythrose-4-phosphate dehydrogenase